VSGDTSGARFGLIDGSAKPDVQRGRQEAPTRPTAIGSRVDLREPDNEGMAARLVRRGQIASPATPRGLSASTPDGPVLRLQRAIGNRATTALLRAPSKPGEFTLIEDLYPKGTMDAATWKGTVASAKAALDGKQFDEARDLYTSLYQDLARTAALDTAGIAADLSVNLAKVDDTGYRPGLNLILGSGGSKGGSTGFVDKSGHFNVSLDLSLGAEVPAVAIRLYSSAFVEDKARSLGVLRHEMTHAHHNHALLELVASWRSTLRPAASENPQAHVPAPGDAFESWLKANAKKLRLSAADVALALETERHQVTYKTEVLAYIEEFMTAFALIQPEPTTHDPIFAQLLGALESGRWAGAEEDVRKAAEARLDAYYCNVLKPAQRKVFDDWVAEQAAKTGTESMRDSFVAMLKSVGAKCRGPKPSPRSAATHGSR
jgi:hypothetical protein